MDLEENHLTHEVRAALDQYFDLADGCWPGLVEGFYLVGSIALGDYRPGLSDIDFVGVCARDLSETEVQALEEIHLALARRSGLPKFDGIYTSWAGLAAPSGGQTVCHWLDRTMQRASRYGANPVTWATLRMRPLRIRGRANPEVFHDDAALRQWCKDNLADYWTGWVRESRWPGPRFLASFSLWAIGWGVLGVTRLHATIRTGRIISKTDAYNYAKLTFPAEWGPILDVAISARNGELRRMADEPMTSAKPPRKLGFFERRTMALRFVEYVIADVSGIDESGSVATGV